ncbi:MAG: hypothetical protein P1V51_17140 [Deltaproteobacteria bacterium]|nr:hypothetical protein [Deltaproteobacteria bacterium]
MAPEIEPVDLGGFRVGFSQDERRLAYLSRAPGGRSLLFTVVGTGEGRRITDFLLVEAADRERALRLLEAGGYRPPVERCPPGKGLRLVEEGGVWASELRLGEAAGPGKVGKHFQEALQAISGVSPERLGCSPGGRYVVFALRGSGDEGAPWPRSVVALPFEAPAAVEEKTIQE